MMLDEKRELLADYFKKIIFDVLELHKYCDIEHLQDTPHRIAKMYIDELLYGVYNNPENLLKEFPLEDPETESCPVIVDGIEVRSLCSHHFMPFYGKCRIVYIPSDKILGLSKFSRIVDFFSRKPQVQENLTNEIANFIMDKIKPHCIGVRIKAKHLCMSHRGAKSDGCMETYQIKPQQSEYYDTVYEILMKGDLKL